MSVKVFVVAAAVGLALTAWPAAAQERRGPEETERVTRTFKLGDNGRFTLSNVSGDVVVTGGSGGDLSVEAVKRTRGARAELASVLIEFDERPGRVEVRTRHTARRDRAAVDFTVTVPRGATVDLSSVSGDVRVTDVRGALRAQSVSGTVRIERSPNVELAKTISGDVEFAGDAPDARLTGSTVSGTARATGVKARLLSLSAISGNAEASNVEAERVEMKTISGDVVFAGTPARNARYEFNAHSGAVRLTLGESAGFELSASTFSGTIRSNLSVALGATNGSRRRTGRSARVVVGSGGAMVDVSTFSGDIVIERR
jgi:DUF4097 and DUF4098 domain-containing protein YvlB